MTNQIAPPPDMNMGEMSLLDHLDELRQRVMVASAALLITTVLCFVIAKPLVEIIADPVDGIIDGKGIGELESIDVTENFQTFFQVSLLGGLTLAMPVLLYQFIAFIVPGLLPHEKRTLFISLPVALFMFLVGIAFAYFILVPRAVDFLTNLLGIPTAIRPKTYFSFVTRLIFWLGVSFETPLVMALLARLGVISPEFLLRNVRYAVVIIAIIAALITPTPDPMNMGMVMLPLFVLYGIGILLAKLMYRPRE